MKLIQNLIDNHPKTNETENMDLVLESGAANGGFHVGCLLYIKSLEKKKIIKIDRISGSSIGAIAGFYYLINSLQDFLEIYKKMRDCFKNNLNVGILKSILEKKINELSDEEFIYLNERLFIVYYDVSQRKQIQINKFTEKKDLLNSLLKSSHIPFITQNSLYYVDNETNSLDGGMPYVFPKRNVGDKKILYINICVYNKLTSLFSVKKELNPYGRLLEGALDAHNFFLYKGKSKFCSFVNNWGIFDYTLLRLKELIFKMLIYSIIICYYVYKIFYPLISRFYIVEYLSPVFYNFYRDVLLFYCI